MPLDNYVTFICNKYADIHRDNGYCQEEEHFGNYLEDEFEKRCNYVTQAFFLDYGFEFKFVINNKEFSSLLTVINDKDKKFALSISSTLNKIEKFIGFKDEKEQTYLNQIIDDILRLDDSISKITWSLKAQADLNMDENN